MQESQGGDPPPEVSVCGTVYTLVTSADRMYAASGDEVFTRINWASRRMILSPRLSGRHAKAAALRMYQEAWRRESGSKPLGEEEKRRTAMMLEELLSFALPVVAAPEPPAAAVQVPEISSNRYRSSRGLVAALVFLGSTWVAVFAAYMVTFGPKPVTPLATTQPPVQLQRTLVQGELIEGMRREVVPYPAPALAAVPHPTRPGFVIADVEHRVYYVESVVSRRLLAETSAPARLLHVAPDGSAVAVLDWAGRVHLVPFAPDGQITSYPVPAADRVYAVSRDGVICVDEKVGRVWSEGLGGIVFEDQAMAAQPSTGGGGYWAVTVRGDGGHDTLMVGRPGEPEILRRRVFAGRQLRSFDVAADASEALLFFEDAMLSHYRRGASGMLELNRQIDLGRPRGSLQVRISENGGWAWVSGDRLARWRLDRLEPVAQAAPGEATKDEFLAMHYQPDGGGRVLTTFTRFGVIHRR